MDINKMTNEQLALFWELSSRIPEQKQLIETQLQLRITANQNFSREFIFESTYKGRRVISVHFIPSSPSYARLGKFVTVLEIVLNDEEKLQYLSNIVAQPAVNTYGDITCKIMQDDTAELLTVTFNTQDILSTLV
jgi:hypothetical protein